MVLIPFKFGFNLVPSKQLLVQTIFVNSAVCLLLEYAIFIDQPIDSNSIYCMIDSIRKLAEVNLAKCFLCREILSHL